MERTRWLAAGAIVAAGAAAYADSFPGGFVLDDSASIVDNPTLRHLGDLRAVLTPLHAYGLTVDGRPLLNLSFAVNWAISGDQVWSYHALNLAIHLLAGLTLFGILCRLVEGRAGRPGPPSPTGSPCHSLATAGDATLFAFVVALLWTVHPLNTAAVTYISQRAESMMGMFYLVTVYYFVRYAEQTENESLAASATGSGGRSAKHEDGERMRVPKGWPRWVPFRAIGGTTRKRFGARFWATPSILACFADMATKEVMVSAPLTVLLLDRLCFAGSLREAWKRRRGYYAAIFSSWILLAALVWRTGSRGGTSGLGAGVSLLRYWATQPAVILRYLRLAFWPHPLVFDYGTVWASGPALAALAVLALAAAVLWGLWRNRAWGFLGFVFFAILAPTSLVPGNRQTAAEHRMYLALIPVILGTAIVCGWPSTSGRRHATSQGGPPSPGGRRPPRITAQLNQTIIIFGLALAIPAAFATYRRNLDYSSPLRLFGHDVALNPDNPYAQTNYGEALLIAGRDAEAEGRFRAALRIDPKLAVAEDDLGGVLFRRGDGAEAEAHFQRALALDPRFTLARENLAVAYLQQHRLAEARPEIEAVLRAGPGRASAHYDSGLLLAEEGRLDPAQAEFHRAIALAPDQMQFHLGLGNVWRAAGRPRDALDEYAAAAALEPGNSEIDYDWAGALADLGRNAEAERHLRRAAALEPANPAVHQNLGNVLLAENQPAAALAEYEISVRLAPAKAAAHYNYANGLARLGRREAAIAELRTALGLDPALDPARRLLQTLSAAEP